jgi:hypothetical protein
MIAKPMIRKKLNGKKRIRGAKISKSIPIMILPKQNPSHIISKNIPSPIIEKPMIFFILVKSLEFIYNIVAYHCYPYCH